MLKVFRQPFSMRSGCDILDDKTQDALRAVGLMCQFRDLWPNEAARVLCRVRPIPGSGRLFKYGIAGPFCMAHLSAITAHNVVWVHDFSLPFDTVCAFERAIRHKGAPYVYNIQDDWFSVPELEVLASPRAQLADLIVVPTQALAERIQSLFPGAEVEVLEEPVDLDRLDPAPFLAEVREPRIVWCGNPANFFEISYLAEVLAKAHAQAPFVFRIVGGIRRPKFDLAIPWEWFPYNYAEEAHLLAGAVAGLAPLADTLFARCKGAYKVKTYLAAGVPPVASDVGYQAEVVRDGETGLLVRNKEDWPGLLIGLVKNSEQARRMGAAARSYVADHFTRACVAPQWKRTLQRRFPKRLGNVEDDA